MLSIFYQNIEKAPTDKPELFLVGAIIEPGNVKFQKSIPETPLLDEVLSHERKALPPFLYD
jgi:hypothetical protein